MLNGLTTFKDRFGEIRYVFAPMAGISDTVFRLLMREMGAQMVVSELLSAEGLVRGGKKTHDMLQYDVRERPIGIQIFGGDTRSMTEAARIVQGIGADFVDINFGCPVKKVVCDGGGAAWLKDPVALGKLLQSMKSVLTIPLSIKIRTGWDENSKNAEEIVKVAAESGVEWVAIHGRTRAQGYSGLADWDHIRNISQNSPIPIIGNGDLITAELAGEKILKGYCHAVMIGRGALKNPWIFRELFHKDVEKNFIELITRHISIAEEKKEKTRAFLSLKKFMSWYATGFPGASQFRAKIFSTNDLNELKDTAYGYFNSLELTNWKFDAQPFLMGGHG